MKPPIIEELRADAAWLRQDAKHASEVGDDLGWAVADKRADLLERAANMIERAAGTLVGIGNHTTGYHMIMALDAALTEPAARELD
jgi:hypothetical protein